MHAYIAAVTCPHLSASVVITSNPCRIPNFICKADVELLAGFENDKDAKKD